MTNRSYKTILVALAFLLSCNKAYAGLILNNSQEVGFLNLTESFQAFYDYNNGSRFASDTGLEIEDSFVFFLAAFNGETALFGLLDGTNGGEDVLFDVSLTDSSSSLGNLILKDDPSSDLFTSLSPGSHLFEYNMRDRPGRGDGFVYRLGDSESTSIDVSSLFIDGQARGAFFVSFDEGTSEIINLGSSVESIDFSLRSVEVSAPSSIALFSLSMLLVSLRRKK